MNSKTTWSCLAVAALVFAFIFFFELPRRERANEARSTKIFPGFNTKSVSRVEVRANRNEIFVIRTNSSWLLTNPFVYPADDERVEALLNALANLSWQSQITAAELKNNPKAQEEFGFNAPIASLVIEGSGVNLLIGTNTPVGEQVYVQVVGSAGIYVIDWEFLKLLPRHANDWRDPFLFRFSGPINTIKSRAGNKAFTLVHTNGSWRLPQARADNAKITELLKKTAEVQIKNFETEEPQDLEQFGLQSPEMELSFAFDTNVLATLHVGRSPTNDPSVVFAKLQNQNHILRVSKDALAEWRASATNFMDRHLVSLSSNEIPQITRLDVRGEDSFSLQRKGNSWSIPTAPDFPVDSGLVAEALKLLGHAEVDIEKDVVTDFSSYGLASPALEYTLKKNGSPSNSIFAQIHFGTNQSGKVFVRRLDEYPDTVNSIRPDHYDRLPRASWQFRNRRIWSFVTNEVVSVTVHQKGKDRKLVRNAKGDLSFAPGSEGIINTFALEEALYRLGELRAVFWVSPDEKDQARFGIKEADHRLLLEIKRDGKTEMLSLDFGETTPPYRGFSEYGTLYTAITLNGARMIFEFPWPLFFEVQDSLTIP